MPKTDAEIDKKSAASYFKLAQSQVRNKQKEAAIANYQKAIELNPKHWNAYHKLGQLLLKKGHYQEAVECYQRAIELQPKRAELYLDFGHALRYQGKRKQAIDCYFKALELEPVNWRFYTALQYTKVNKNWLDDVILNYRRILEKKPDFPLALQNLGDALTQKGNIDEAICCYQKSCYKQTIWTHPHLAKLDWKPQKESSPDFIIIGDIKCGTSSLHAYLNSHPRILFPLKKELQFFSNHFDRGVDWYLAHFPAITDRPELLTGEASPGYFGKPGVDRLIHQLFPDIKLILLLRNPVDRALSRYFQKKKVGQGMKRSFAEIVTQEMENFNQDSGDKFTEPKGLLLGGLYIYKLQRWMNLFSPEQFLILHSESFFRDPARTMERVYHFLGLPDNSEQKYEVWNAGAYSPMDAELRETLVDFCRPHNQKLEEYLGMKFDWN
ncbi:MAG: tetratricopeptide repeat protein [Cyanobacteriota bacterium]|nr:tetratricopeptide repeat protein [Cyanobacteriota bacterium]